MQTSPVFGLHWRQILEIFSLAMAHSNCESLVETVPAALQAMLLVLHDAGLLVAPGSWVDSSDGTDLWELTWQSSRKISSNLVPEMLQQLAAGQGAPSAQPAPVATQAVPPSAAAAAAGPSSPSVSAGIVVAATVASDGETPRADGSAQPQSPDAPAAYDLHRPSQDAPASSDINKPILSI